MDSGSWILSTPLAQDPRSESAVTAFASVAGLLHLVRAFAACQAACSLGSRIRVTPTTYSQHKQPRNKRNGKKKTFKKL